MLRARTIACSYDGPEVLADVSLELRPGEFVAVAGPNGSGKSTLVRALSRVLPPRRGSVLLGDRDLYALPARESARAIAVVPQDTPLDFEFTCEEVVMMGRAPHVGRFGSEGEADRAAVKGAMERTGVWEFRGRSILELSGGERQRVLLGRALAQDAPVLLLDEPTAHLDPAHQVRILRTIRALLRDRDLAVLATLHDLNLASTYADRMLLLSAGRVAAEGSPAEVLVPETLGEVFGEDLRVRPHPETGRPWVWTKP